MQTMMLTSDVSDEVIDAIAYIEMQRQEKARESGVAAACSESMRKLQELLAQEKAAPADSGDGRRNAANVEAVSLEIQRIQRMASGKNNGGGGRNSRRGHQQRAPDRNDPRRQGRNKGRRQSGRGGER
jgi:bacterioferritin-associated ferredoxin